MEQRIDRTSFSNLLRRWNAHQDLRQAGAPVDVLAASRIRLDTARDQLRRLAA